MDCHSMSSIHHQSTSSRTVWTRHWKIWASIAEKLSRSSTTSTSTSTSTRPLTCLQMQCTVKDYIINATSHAQYVRLQFIDVIQRWLLDDLVVDKSKVGAVCWPHILSNKRGYFLLEKSYNFVWSMCKGVLSTSRPILIKIFCYFKKIFNRTKKWDDKSVNNK